MRITLLAAVSVFVLNACGGDDDGPVGRGSAACQDWQDAICSFSAECGGLPRAQCLAQYQGVTCNSDSEASRCSNLFNRGCSGITESEFVACDIEAIANPAPARQGCHDLIDHYCARAVTCSSSTLDQCVAQQNASIDCEAAIALTLDFEDCIADVDALVCPDTALPDSCSGVLLFPLSSL